VGMAIDFDDKSTAFLVPLFLIIIIRTIDLVSLAINKRHIIPVHGKRLDLYADANITDALLTLLIILTTWILPIILLNEFFNGHFIN
jgi:hypothetical protein